VSREGALVLNNLFLVVACLTVFFGTLYPLALEALTGEKISVGAPFFNATFGPIFLILLLAVPFGPLLAWKRGDLPGVAQRLMAAAGAALVVMVGMAAITWRGPVLAPIMIGIAVFVIAGALTDFAERTAVAKASLATSMRRAAGLPRSAWGTMFAHLGLGVTLIGIVGETQFGSERIAEIKPGQTISISGYDLRFDGMRAQQGQNYRDDVARFVVSRGNSVIGEMEPSKRMFPARATTRTEAALMARGFSQLYVSLGDISPAGTLAVRVYHKPLVLLIWLGTIVMVIGGTLSLTDRRLRVGAPKPARAKAAMQPAE
jgi:cytochrome c-type biogenesis protein CcmF